jgi:tetratricopeptide (TPR) repeat protein
MTEIVNPYIAGAPVVEARMFFGREDVFDWIQNSLTGRYANHILVIHGQRRVGKTSVLKQLGNRLPEKYIPVFFDLQGRTHTTLDRFLWWLGREIVRVLKQDRGIEVPLPEKEAFAEDLEFFESRFLPGLRPLLGERVLLLTFDEFDNLEESEIKDSLARPLIDHLRRLMGQDGLNFIFSIGSSGRKLENMQASYTEFFKTALYKKISFLSKEQTFGLVTRPVEGVLEYEREAVDRIYSIASGHPYFTQLTCHELFSLCQRTGELRIREVDVESILNDVVERGTVNLKFVWDEASDIEKWGLASLAHLEGKADTPALADFLRKQRLRFSESDLTSGLLHLREKDILTEENRFVIYLLKLWLKKNRPIDQVREELTEVNPIANRYIEIGMEFQDSGQFEKAIENFREALAVAPEHVQAQVNIALAYMAQKAYDKAIVEFEKALTMDDEDVAARAGLCEAHLALGDAAMTRGRAKDATLSYQRVLAINIEHTEAHGRMAELSRQRAEKALVDGKDEEALSAFIEALKFTPEDPSLIERVNKVRAEKKAKVLAVLLARSEKEAAAKNWEGAIKSLKEALPLAPDDASIQRKLSEVKTAQEKARLDALLAKADTAVKSARWDEAVKLLTAALATKPDEAVEVKLTEVRSQQHEARLSELKTQARGLAHTERFDEALAAWKEYLALEPADHEKAQVETEEVKKTQALAMSYAEAQKAYSKKNYDQAVSILKGIINQDENYKDASRLLAQAIELRRTAPKWWQSKFTKESVRFQKPKSRSGIKTGVKRIWIVGILLAILILGVGGPLLWYGRNSLSAIPGFFGTPTPPPELPFTVTVEPTPTLTPTRTPYPTLAPRPLPTTTANPTPDPMQAFELSIRTYMTEHAPTFEDDFSTPDMVWGGNSGGFSIYALVKDGVLTIVNRVTQEWMEPDNNVYNTTFPTNGLLNASNFALQFDFVFETYRSVDIVAVQFRSYEILFYRTGEWDLYKNDDSQKTYITGGRYSEDTLLIIAYNKNLAVYLNGTLFYATNEIALSGSKNTITVTGEVYSEMDFDNFKFWDLEGVDFNP